MHILVLHCTDAAMLIFTNLHCTLLQGNLLGLTACQQLAVDILGAMSKSCYACSTFYTVQMASGQIDHVLELVMCCNTHTS